MDPAVAFGITLRKARKDANLSQENLALAAGIERNYVSLIERGINQPSIRVIFKLASALNLAASELLYETELEIQSSHHN